MEIDSRSRLKTLAYPFVIIFALLIARYYNGVLLFHTLAELFSIFVGLLMLVVVLNTQHFVRNDFLIYLGIGYFSISVLDALHAFTVKGLPFFQLVNNETTLHFWIYSRLFEALLLLSAPLFLTFRLNVRLMSVLTAIFVCIIGWASFYLTWPVMFIDGALSDFKVNTELIVIILLASSIFIYWRKKALFEKHVLFYLLSSLSLTIVAELCFTLYSDFMGGAFVVGHVFKFLSFWMIYQAIIQTTLNEPLKLLTIRSNSYDAIPNPAIRVDEFAIISQVNRAALQIVDKSLEEIIHQPVHLFFHPDIEEGSENEKECIYCQAIRTGQTVTDQEVYLTQRQQWFLLSITPIDSLNSKAGVVQSLTNITYQKHQEAELLENKNFLEIRVKERTEELEASFKKLAEAQNQLVESKKMASLGDLVAGVAHEINTPVGICITAASNLSELTSALKNDFMEEKVSKTGFEQYIASAEKSSHLIESNLYRAAELIGSFKQVSVDQSSERLRTFFLKAYITEILSSLAPKLKRRDIIIHFSDNDDFEVNISPSAIAQIVTNFIMNSLFHAFEESDSGDIFISVTRESDKVELIYRDSGKGISNENLAHVFEPFFTTRRGQGGSGLGLHITYNLVIQSLNGEITCDSKEGEGVIFTVKFPTVKE